MTQQLDVDSAALSQAAISSRTQTPLDIKRACALFAARVERLVTTWEAARSHAEKDEMFDALKEFASRSALRDIPKSYAEALNDRFESLRGAYLTFYQQQEYRAAERMLTKGRSLESAFRSHNHALLQVEVLQADINRDSRVAFVGCGCLPWSSIGISRYSGATVVAFDREEALVALAQHVLQRLGLTESVNARASEGSSIDYSEFSHVYLAGMCDQKDELVQKLSKSMAIGSKLLIRSARSPFQIFYPQFISRVLPGFTLLGSATSPEVEELETIVFQKAQK